MNAGRLRKFGVLKSILQLTNTINQAPARDAQEDAQQIFEKTIREENLSQEFG